MHHHHHHGHQHHHEHQHHHGSEGCHQKWQQQHPNYAAIDSGPQTFFYTLTNMLKLNEAKNILEIGCGAGKLLSTVLDLKNQDASYYATDVSQGMIGQAKKRLEAHFAKYQSKISFQEWLDKVHMKFEVQNGEQLCIKENIKFDRILANMVLCHAEDPEKMLKNWSQNATENCLLGISLMGDPVKNKFIKGINQSIQQVGYKIPQERQNYYWYDKISKIVENSGWQIVLDWQQNTLFPILQFDATKDDSLLKHMIQKKVPEKARDSFKKRLQKLVKYDKQGIQVWSKLIIAKKRIQNQS